MDAMTRFLRSIPTLEKVEADSRLLFPKREDLADLRTLVMLRAYYPEMRRLLIEHLTDPDEDDEPEHEHGDPVAALEVESLEEVDAGATVDYGTLPTIDQTVTLTERGCQVAGHR